MGSTPLVSKSLTSSLSEFLSCWAGSDILGCRPCWCLSPFPSPYNLGVFPSTLHMPLDFIRVSSLWPTYLHPFGLPFTYNISELPGLGLALVPDVVVPEAEQNVTEISIQISALIGVEPRIPMQQSSVILECLK